MSMAKFVIDRSDALGAAHQARLATPAPTSKRLVKLGPITTREETVRRMADAMLDIMAAKGSVEEADLLNFGYSRHAVASLGADARELANSLFVRRAS